MPVHDKGALGRDRRARQHQIAGQHDERGRRRDLLDRVAQRHKRDQRQTGAHREKDKPADQPQMQTGDRQQVLQPATVERRALTGSAIAPRLPVISAEATPPVEPGRTA